MATRTSDPFWKLLWKQAPQWVVVEQDQSVGRTPKREAITLEPRRPEVPGLVKGWRPSQVAVLGSSLRSG